MKIKCHPLDQHRCSIVELSSRRAARSVHLHFPPTIVSFDTSHRPRSLPPSVPSRCCVWRAVPGCCCCFGCLVNTPAAGMVKDRTGRWRGCRVGCRTRIVTQDVPCRCSGCCWEGHDKGGVLPRRLATPNNTRGQRGGASGLVSLFCSDLTYLSLPPS